MFNSKCKQQCDSSNSSSSHNIHTFHLVNGTAPSTTVQKTNVDVFLFNFSFHFDYYNISIEVEICIPISHRVQRQTCSRPIVVVPFTNVQFTLFIHYLYFGVAGRRTHTLHKHISQMCLYLCLVTCDGTFKMT